MSEDLIQRASHLLSAMRASLTLYSHFKHRLYRCGFVIKCLCFIMPHPLSLRMLNASFQSQLRPIEVARYIDCTSCFKFKWTQEEFCHWHDMSQCALSVYTGIQAERTDNCSRTHFITCTVQVKQLHNTHNTLSALWLQEV